MRRGRKRQPGARYPGGKLRPVTGETPMSQFHRIKTLAKHGSADPRMGTVLARLHLVERKPDGTPVLSEAEVAAGFKYAEIVGRYDRVALPVPQSRQPKGPAYERGHAAFASMHDDVHETERREKRIRKQYRKAQELIPTEEARAVLEQVCCDDREIHSSFHADLKAILGRLAKKWGYTGEGPPKKARTYHTPDAKYSMKGSGA
jgi:hypothetical protein